MTKNIFDKIKDMDIKWDRRTKPFGKCWHKDIDREYYGNQTAIDMVLSENILFEFSSPYYQE